MASIINKSTIKNILSSCKQKDLMQCIEQAFIAYSQEQAVVPPVGALSFDKPRGDVHIKYGYIKNEPYYAIKIASSFYENPTLGLPSSDGLILVFEQKTGILKTILMDEGYLTDIRTAVAGAICAKYLAPEKVQKIGIVGSGTQARLQLMHLKGVVDCRNVLVWGRLSNALEKYKEDMSKEGFNVETTTDAQDIGQSCNLIVTTTPSTSPLIDAKDIQKGTLITAMGADTIGKQELDTSILLAADSIVVDSLTQCQHHGEIHKAYQSGLLEGKRLTELGKIVAEKTIRRPENITVVDLTGIATQDIQIAKFALENSSDHLKNND